MKGKLCHYLLFRYSNVTYSKLLLHYVIPFTVRVKSGVKINDLESNSEIYSEYEENN